MKMNIKKIVNRKNAKKVAKAAIKGGDVLQALGKAAFMVLKAVK